MSNKKFGILNLTDYSYKKDPDAHPLNWQKNHISTPKQRIVRILAMYKNIYLVQLKKPAQINMGWGPTLPSSFAILDTKTKDIDPIMNDNFAASLQTIIDMKDNDLDAKCINTIMYRREKYTSVGKETCAVCLDKPNNVYVNCETDHLCCCSSCIGKLDKCPICYHIINGYNEVVYL